MKTQAPARTSAAHTAGRSDSGPGADLRCAHRGPERSAGTPREGAGATRGVGNIGGGVF